MRRRYGKTQTFQLARATVASFPFTDDDGHRRSELIALDYNPNAAKLRAARLGTPRTSYTV